MSFARLDIQAPEVVLSSGQTNATMSMQLCCADMLQVALGEELDGTRLEAPGRKCIQDSGAYKFDKLLK